MIKRPLVFDYRDYRLFLSDMVHHMKAFQGLSVRALSKQAEFKSSSYFSMIIKGQRKLSLESARKLAIVFGLSKSEADFLERLILFTDAATYELKDRFYREMLAFERFQKTRALEVSEYQYFSNWYCVALFEGLATRWADKTSVDMAADLGISETEVNKVLNLLKKVGLIDQKDGKWIRIAQKFMTPSELQGLPIRNFHKEMMAKALESLDNLSPEERRFYSLTVPLSKKSYDRLQSELADYLMRLNSRMDEDEEADAVYEIHLQFFPLLALQQKANEK